MTDYTLKTLKNGLRLILIPRTSTEVVTLLAMFRVGSRQESDDISGISHVLEHMHYKGTKKRPSGFKISEFIESIGGEHNAFTGKEYTGYYAKVMPKHLAHAFDFLSDILMNSKFDSVELEKEKKVIIQEINMYEDLPMEMVGSHFEKVIFGDNALGRDIIGTKQTVGAATREKLLNYKERFYRPENAVIALSGNFGDCSEAHIEALAEKYFPFDRKEVEMTPAIELASKKNMRIVEKKTEQSHLVVGFRTVSLNHPDYFKLELLGIILGGSMSSRMFEEIREKRGLAYSVRTHSCSFVESGAIMTQAGTEHNKIYEAIEAIIGEYSKIKQSKVPQAELDKAREIILGKMLIKFEDSEEVAYHFASEVLLAKEILTLEKIKEIYQKITPDDILEVAQKYLIDDRMGLSFIGPEIDEKKIENLFKI